MVWKIKDIGKTKLTATTAFTNQSTADIKEKRQGKYTVYDGVPISMSGTTFNFNQSNNTNSETPLDNFNDNSVFTGSSNNADLVFKFVIRKDDDVNNQLIPFMRDMARSKGIKALYNDAYSTLDTSTTSPLKYFGNYTVIGTDLPATQPRIYVRCTDFRFDDDAKSNTIVDCSFSMIFDEANDL